MYTASCVGCGLRARSICRQPWVEVSHCRESIRMAVSFPARKRSIDSISGKKCRYHVMKNGLQKVGTFSSQVAAISKRVGTHTLRLHLPSICWTRYQYARPSGIHGTCGCENDRNPYPRDASRSETPDESTGSNHGGSCYPMRVN